MELAFCIAASIFSSWAVEAEVNCIRGDYLWCWYAGHIVNAKGSVEFLEQAVSIIGEPAIVPEFKDSNSAFGQSAQEGTQAVNVLVEIWGQLVQNRAEISF